MLANHNANQPILKTLLLLIISVGMILSIYLFLPVGQDWMGIRITVQEMLHGQTSFSQNVFNPPWILALLIPLAWLPFKLGAALLSFLNIAVYGYVALRLGKSPFLAALLLLTPAIIRQVIDPNLEFLVALGLLLPPQAGIFLVMAKPQLGAPIAIFWAFEAWREGGLRNIVRVFAPIALVTLISFAIYGLWPLRAGLLLNTPQNVSMWPTSLVFGLPLIFQAVRTRSLDMALLSAAFLAPYYGFYSLHIPLLGLLPRRSLTVAAVLGFWIIFFLGVH